MGVRPRLVKGRHALLSCQVASIHVVRLNFYGVRPVTGGEARLERAFFFLSFLLYLYLRSRHCSLHTLGWFSLVARGSIFSA